MALTITVSEEMPDLPQKIFRHFVQKYSLEEIDRYRSRPFDQADYDLAHLQLSRGDMEVMEADSKRKRLFETVTYSVPSKIRDEYYKVTQYYRLDYAKELQAMGYPITEKDLQRIVADIEREEKGSGWLPKAIPSAYS